MDFVKIRKQLQYSDCTEVKTNLEMDAENKKKQKNKKIIKRKVKKDKKRDGVDINEDLGTTFLMHNP